MCVRFVETVLYLFSVCVPSRRFAMFHHKLHSLCRVRRALFFGFEVCVPSRRFAMFFITCTHSLELGVFFSYPVGFEVCDSSRRFAMFHHELHSLCRVSRILFTFPVRFEVCVSSRRFCMFFQNVCSLSSVRRKIESCVLTLHNLR